jgi:hypothetical protein
MKSQRILSAEEILAVAGGHGHDNYGHHGHHGHDKYGHDGHDKYGHDGHDKYRHDDYGHGHRSHS